MKQDETGPLVISPYNSPFKFMFYVYFLQSLKDGKTYVGYTSDLKDRLLRHQCGHVKSTKHRRPFKVLFVEQFVTLKEAKDRELYWKSSSGRNKLRTLFK